MAPWGPGIFEEKQALDIRDQFEELFDKGMSVGRITEILADKWAIDVDDEEDGTVFWIALAATQLENEVLEEDVKERVLFIIDEEIDIDLFWYDSDKIDERRDELDELKEKLLFFE